jgi:hypothetical protein
VHDPGIGFVTLTRVQVTPDLQQAHGVLHGARRREEPPQHRTRRSPARRVSAPPDRRRLAAEADARADFHYDESIAGQDRIEQLLSEIQPSRAPTTMTTNSPDSGHRSTRSAAPALRAVVARRPDGDSIGSQLAMASRCARSARRRSP